MRSRVRVIGEELFRASAYKQEQEGSTDTNH